MAVKRKPESPVPCTASRPGATTAAARFTATPGRSTGSDSGPGSVAPPTSKRMLLMRTAKPTTSATGERLLGPRAGGSAEAPIAVMDATWALRPEIAQRGRLLLAMSSGATTGRRNRLLFLRRVPVDNRADGISDARNRLGQHEGFRRGALEHVLAGKCLIKSALINCVVVVFPEHGFLRWSPGWPTSGTTLRPQPAPVSWLCRACPPRESIPPRCYF